MKRFLCSLFWRRGNRRRHSRLPWLALYLADFNTQPKRYR